jgi:hypothetical protein
MAALRTVSPFQHQARAGRPALADQRAEQADVQAAGVLFGQVDLAMSF